MSVPGLVKTEIVDDGGEFITIVETWDLTVPGCPLVAFDRSKIGALSLNHLSRREYENLLRASSP